MPDPSHLMVLTGTLTRVTQDGTKDRYGDPAENPGGPETVKCWLYQTARDEHTATDNTQDQTADLWLPAGTDPTGLDRIEVNGVTWQFVGPPLQAMNPRSGAVSHIEATVRATT